MCRYWSLPSDKCPPKSPEISHVSYSQIFKYEIHLISPASILAHIWTCKLLNIYKQAPTQSPHISPFKYAYFLLLRMQKSVYQTSSTQYSWYSRQTTPGWPTASVEILSRIHRFIFKSICPRMHLHTCISNINSREVFIRFSV